MDFFSKGQLIQFLKVFIQIEIFLLEIPGTILIKRKPVDHPAYSNY